MKRILKPQQRRLRQNPNELNEYFSNLAATLTNKQNEPLDQKQISDLLPTVENDNAFHIKYTSYAEVHKTLLGLRDDCSCGSDQIPAKFLKAAVDHITSPIVHLINSSIDCCIFPDLWKTARIVPIPKVDNPTKMKDFRPI